MAIIPAYNPGDKIRIGNHAGTNLDGSSRDAFKDVLGVITDPTTVKVKLRKLPDGTAKVYGWPTPDTDGVLTKEATGRFYVDYTALSTDDARWAWRLEGSGVITTADEGEFRILPTAF